MALIKQVTGNLSGGVTTLAEAHRLPNQTDEQINAEPSLRDGLRKRAKTDYAGKFSGDFADAKFHFVTGSPIFTGGPTKHMLAVKTDGISAVDIDSGDALGVYTLTRDSSGNITGGSAVTSSDLSYLAENSPDPAQDFQLVTAEDVTFVLNKKAVTDDEVTSGTVHFTNNYGYLFVKGLVGQGTSNAGIATVSFSATNGGTVNTVTRGLAQAYVPSGATYTYDTQFTNPADLCSVFRAEILGTNGFTAPFETSSGTTTFRIPYDASTDFQVSSVSRLYDSANDNYASFAYHPHGVIPFARTAASNESFAFLNWKAGYSGGDDFVSVFYREVARLDDLPLICHHGKTVKVTGTADTEYDDYYVTFKTKDGDVWGDGVWQETTAAPWDKYGLDADTMPHVLIRRQDTTLGTVTGTALAYYYEWAPMDGSVSDINDGEVWGYRTVGDQKTNPNPSFVGKSIQALTIYQGRLALMTPEGDVCLSEAGNYFNFYRTSILTLIDSDTIGVSVGGNDAGLFRHLVPFSRELLLLGDGSQYSLNNGGGVVSPATVSVDQVSGYEVSPSARPALLENTAVFVSQGAARTQVWQMFRENDTAYTAAETSDAIPGYIKGTVSHIATSSVVGSFALINGSQDMYMHSYFRQGNQIAMQSWWKMRVAGCSKITHAHFYGDTLYVCAVKDANGGTETVVLVYEPDNEEVYKADLVRTVASSEISYASGTDESTVTIPYGMQADDTLFAYNETDDVELDVLQRTNGATQGTFRLAGDMTAKTIVYGIRMDMSVKLHHPTLPLRNNTGSQSPERAMRVLINKMDLTYTDTRPFEVKVESPHRPTRTYRRPATLIGSLEGILENPRTSSGVLELGVHLPTEEADITISDDNPWPVRLENIQWEMNYRPRAKTWAGR